VLKVREVLTEAGALVRNSLVDRGISVDDLQKMW
jgi:hypothetical protein